MVRLAALVSLVLAGCTPGRVGAGTHADLVVEVRSDQRVGVDVVALRVEVARDALFEGETVRRSIPLEGVALEDGVRAFDGTLEPLGPAWVRVALLDASGRVRAERVAELDVQAARTVTLGLDTRCAARACPEDEDPDAAEALACVNDTCVPETCVDVESCPVGVLCESDDDCSTDSPCRHAVCVEGACLALDACGAGEVCAPDGCVDAPTCGDGACDPGTETPCSCEADCGACPDRCGDGACDDLDDAARCPEDCGSPEPVCGDAVCEVDAESTASCPEDCARGRAPVCGDAICEGAERCAECGECCEDRGCGDGVCDPGEGCDCAIDCGSCEVCGDGRCDVGESCPDDCDDGSVCGDGVCDATESCARCDADCGWCTGYPRREAACGESTGAPSTETCAGIGGAFASSAVHVAYYPMRVVAFEGAELTSGAVTIAELPEGARFAVRSTRNAPCDSAPPMAPARDGMVLGYAPDLGEAGWGWVAIDDLALEDDERAACPYGPRGLDFAVRLDRYAAASCAPLACAAGDVLRTCGQASREDPSECAGRAVDARGAVGPEVARLRLSPDGPTSGFLHAGDAVRVLYESGRAGWVFVEALDSAAPELAPPGTRGWMNATEVDR